MNNILYPRNEVRKYFADFFKGKDLKKNLVGRDGCHVPDFQRAIKTFMDETQTPVISFLLAVHLHKYFGNSQRKARKRLCELVGKPGRTHYTIEGEDFDDVMRRAFAIPDDKEISILTGLSGLSGIRQSLIFSPATADPEQYLRDNFRYTPHGRPSEPKTNKMHYIPTFSLDGLL